MYRDMESLLKENLELKRLVSKFVFCKDCKYWNDKKCRVHKLPTREEHFCEWGERK